MGRATITGGGTDGLYTAKVEYDGRAVQTAITAIISEIVRIDSEIPLIQAQIDEIQADIDEKYDEVQTLAAVYTDAVNQALLAGRAEDVTHPWSKVDPDWPLGFGYDMSFGHDMSFGKDVSLDPGGMKALQYLLSAMKASAPNEGEAMQTAYTNLLKAAADLGVLKSGRTTYEKMRDMRQLRKEALQKKKTELQAAVDPDDERSMWCADLTEDLSGEVDTLEVIGAPDQILVGPGGSDGYAETGKLANVKAMSPAQCALAWALLPGWQKWRPTYRVGTIHDIDYDADTASVTLDAAGSIAQGLDINQASELAAIPVDYMWCNANAFETGDRVVVEFPGQLWDQGPKVIGFETDPKLCPGYSAIVGSTLDFASFNDDNIFEWRQGDPSGVPGDTTTATLYSSFPTDGKLNNAYQIGSKIKLGASWRYPFEFVDGRQYTMAIAFNLIVYGETGTVQAIVPVRVDYGPVGFTAKDKSVGRWAGAIFAISYSIATTSGPHYVHDIQCHPLLWGMWGESDIAFYANWWRYDRRVTFMNQIPVYNFLYDKLTYTWVDPRYSESGVYEGIPYTGAEVYADMTEYSKEGCASCEAATCSSPGIKCPSEPAAELADYLDIADPCDVVEDKAQLYIDQNWSVEGVIEEDGITLTDSMATLTIHTKTGDINLPFGPFEPLNATLGAAKLTSMGPIATPHHVGWSVQSLNTAASTVTAIAQQSNIGAPANPTWGPRSVYGGEFGFVQFYGIVERARPE